MNEKVDFKNYAQCFRIKDYHCKTTSFTSVVYLFWIIVGKPFVYSGSKFTKYNH